MSGGGGWSAEMASQICGQIQSVFSGRSSSSSYNDPVEVLVEQISATAAGHHTGSREKTGRVFVYGVGREGLMMKALCMRLFHLGLSAHVVGDVTTPPISAGDVLLASAGPGGFSTVEAICRVASSAGARVVLITARPESGSDACRVANAIAYLPAQTMADDAGSPKRSGALPVMLPMGSLYEGAMFVLFEMVVFRLTEVFGQTAAELRSRHTNLE